MAHDHRWEAIEAGTGVVAARCLQCGLQIPASGSVMDPRSIDGYHLATILATILGRAVRDRKR